MARHVFFCLSFIEFCLSLAKSFSREKTFAHFLAEKKNNKRIKNTPLTHTHHHVGVACGGGAARDTTTSRRLVECGRRRRRRWLLYSSGGLAVGMDAAPRAFPQRHAAAERRRDRIIIISCHSAAAAPTPNARTTLTRLAPLCSSPPLTSKYIR